MTYASDDSRPASTPPAAEPSMPIAPSSPPSPSSPGAVEPAPASSSTGNLEPFGTDDDLSRPGAIRAAERPEPSPRGVPRTLVSAVWIGICAGVLALILLIIFVAQNTASVRINFLWMTGNFPIAVALLMAGVAGALIAMAVAAARIIQLRRLVRRR